MQKHICLHPPPSIMLFLLKSKVAETFKGAKGGEHKIANNLHHLWTMLSPLAAILFDGSLSFLLVSEVFGYQWKLFLSYAASNQMNSGPFPSRVSHPELLSEASRNPGKESLLGSGQWCLWQSSVCVMTDK